MHIESIERKIYFSGSVYSAPVDAAASALASINASPSEVLRTAANGVGAPDATPDPATANLIEYHDGLSLYVYPDGAGHPTVGVGLNLDRTGGASGADTLLAAAGLNYDSILTSWTSTKQLWVQKGHSLNQLKTGTAAQIKNWFKFVDQSPSVTEPVITEADANRLLADSIGATVSGVGGSVGPAFYELDRDPQIALIDLAFHANGTAGFTKLVAELRGDATGATDYAAAADTIVLANEAADVTTASRFSDDRVLMRHGEFPTTLTLSPSSETLAPGVSLQLDLSQQNSRGKKILLASDKFTYSTAAPEIASVNDEGLVLAASGGKTTILYGLVDDPALNAQTAVTVNDGTGVSAEVQDLNPVVIAPPNVVAGDTIEITATLGTATGVNKNDNGATLIIESDGGFSRSVGVYNRPFEFSTIAVTDGQSFTARITADESGEDAVVTTRVIKHPTVTFTDTVKATLGRLAADFDELALNAVTTSTTRTLLSAPLTASNVIAAQAGLLGNELNYVVAVNVPDSHFQSIAAVASVPPFLHPVKASKSLPVYLASPLTALQSNAARLLAVLQAADTTANRVEGAVTAGNVAWAARQRAVLLRLNHAAAALLKRHAAILSRVAAVIDRAGGIDPVGPADALTTEQTVQANGLPFPVVQVMQELGANSVAVNAAERTLFVQNTTVVNGSTTAAMTSANLAADLQAAIRALGGK